MPIRYFQSAIVLVLLFATAAVGSLPAVAEIRATLKGHTLALASVDYSPDGRYLATGSYDRTAKIWDAATGTEVATLRGHHGTVEAVRFSPHRKNLAAGNFYGKRGVWERVSRHQTAK